jgi:hypothetical protein
LNAVFYPRLIKQHSLSLQKKIMRKIIVSEFITLDGVIEAPGGNETSHPHGGWQFKYRSPEGGKYKRMFFPSAGRKTPFNCRNYTF